MCSTVYVAQCMHVCVCVWGRGVGEGSKMFFHSQLTFSDSKDNIIWPQMSPLTSANKNPQRNTDANWSYRWQLMAQPIASGVRVYTASPSPPLPPSLSLSLSLSATMASLHTYDLPRYQTQAPLTPSLTTSTPQFTATRSLPVQHT